MNIQQNNKSWIISNRDAEDYDELVGSEVVKNVKNSSHLTVKRIIHLHFQQKKVSVEREKEVVIISNSVHQNDNSNQTMKRKV